MTARNQSNLVSFAGLLERDNITLVIDPNNVKSYGRKVRKASLNARTLASWSDICETNRGTSSSS